MRKSIIFLGILSILILSCSNLFSTKIGDIRGDPRKYAGKEVTISGQVTEVFSLIAFKYFVVKDSSGEITVITSRPLPAAGKKIRVQGIVREAFSIGNENALVIMENP